MLALECKTIETAVEELLRRRGLEWLNNLPRVNLPTLLVGQFAVARWIATERTELLQRDHITVCIAGDGYDLFDRGSLWSVLHVLLDKPIAWATIDLTVPTLVDVIGGNMAPASYRRVVNVMRLDDPRMAAQATQRRWDVVAFPKGNSMALIPSLGAEDENLWGVVEAGVPLLFGLRFAHETHLFEGTALACGMKHGCIGNPFAAVVAEGAPECAYLAWAEGSSRPVQWNEMIQRFCMMEDIEEVVEGIADNSASPTKDDVEDFRQWGARGQLLSSVDASDRYARLPKDHAVRERDGTIYRTEADLRVPRAMRIRVSPESRLAPEPDDAGWVHPVWWASQVWAQGLQDEFENTIGAVLAPSGLHSRNDMRAYAETLGKDLGFGQVKTATLVATLTGGAPYAPTVQERRVFDAVSRDAMDEAMALVQSTPALANAMNEIRDPLLLVVAARGHVPEMRALILAGADVHAVDGGLRPIFAQMARSSGIDAMALMLDAGADVNAHDPIGWTALQIALARGKWDLASMLVERGASTTAGEQFGRSARSMVVEPNGTRGGELERLRTAINEKAGFDVFDALRRNGELHDARDVPAWLRSKILEQ